MESRGGYSPEGRSRYHYCSSRRVEYRVEEGTPPRVDPDTTTVVVGE